MQKDGSGFKLKFQMLAIPTYDRTHAGRSWASVNPGHLSLEIMKEIQEGTKVSLFQFKKTRAFAAEEHPLCLFQVGLSRGKT